MAAKRKSLSKKIRFEVFKRDSFTCQYCGRMAPDTVLEVDHINPIANGGDNDIFNLITSCFDCNRGKGKRKLTEKDEIIKQQEQLKILNVKREQLKMMLDWRKELEGFQDEQLNVFLESFESKLDCTLTGLGKERAKKWIKEFGLMEVLECLDLSYNQYHLKEKNSTEKVFNYIPRIANVRKKQKSDPMIHKRNIIKVILRERISYINEAQLASLLKCMKTDQDFNEMKNIVSNCRNWTDFKNEVNENWGYCDGS